MGSGTKKKRGELRRLTTTFPMLNRAYDNVVALAFWSEGTLLATVAATAGKATEDPKPIRTREAIAIDRGLAENLASAVPHVASDHTSRPTSITGTPPYLSEANPAGSWPMR